MATIASSKRLTLFCLATVVGWAACQGNGSSPADPPTNTGGRGGAGRSGGRSGNGGTGGSGGSESGGSGGGGEGGALVPDGGGVDTGADTQATETGGGDGPKTDAYVLEGAGPFGLAARPVNTTCKPPVSYRKPVMLLTATGCVDSKNPTKPAPGLIPYTVASPLWSDGAAKERFMALPEGSVIHVKDCTAEPDTCKPFAMGGTLEDEGHFIFPVGTVLVKNFLFQKKLIETRLFVKFDDSGDENTSWGGFSYQWNAEQTEATLVAAEGLTTPITNDAGAKQNWYYPSRNDCLLCHNKAPGFALGPSVRNFNLDYMYPSGTKANQIDTLEHIGVLDAKVKRQPAYLDPSAGLTPTTDDMATLDARARSYLQANCSLCHRPEAKHPILDFRFVVDLKTMNACNFVPKSTDPITPADQARGIVPGHPELSVVWGKMNTTGAGRMPQVGTSVPDKVGTQVISDWIKNVVTKCP
jgi:hypothetical protein